jgi:hypothetical protein
MGKIISQTLEVETVHELTQEIEEIVFLKVCNVDINIRTTELTSVGYDNEIGLWEELLHRGDQR